RSVAKLPRFAGSTIGCDRLGEAGIALPIATRPKEMDRKSEFLPRACGETCDAVSCADYAQFCAARATSHRAGDRDRPRRRSICQSITSCLFAKLFAINVSGKFLTVVCACRTPGTQFEECLAFDAIAIRNTRDLRSSKRHGLARRGGYSHDEH